MPIRTSRRHVLVTFVACVLVAASTMSSAGAAGTSDQSLSIVRINAGGSGVSGWSNDTAAAPSKYLVSTSPQQVSTFSQTVDLSDGSVPPKTPAGLFSSERYQWQNGDNLRYSVPTGTGRTTVRLFFSENFAPAQIIGGRVMNVPINGYTVDRNLDVFAYVGANKALVRTYEINSTGSIRLDVTNATGANAPAIKALEIVSPARATVTTTAPPVSTSTTSSSTTSTTVKAVALTSRNYDASTGVIANPDRGFYHYTETHMYVNGSGYVPLNRTQLTQWRMQDHVTLVFRYFYLEKYQSQDSIDQSYLNLIASDFATARAAGVKLVARFAYVQGGSGPYVAPYGDATKARVLGHIQQLSPVLNQNTDVISVLQAGFIGLWGEWYYTDAFAHDPSQPGTLNAADWSARSEVLLKLLDVTNPSILLEVRYPAIKQKVFSGSLATDSRATRVGIHNDCFLASPDDYGTFANSNDQIWLANETKNVSMGGESCNVNAPRSQWPSANVDLEKYHYSFLNADFNTDVLNSWGSAGLMQAQKSLGYRLRLLNSAVQTSVRPGASVAVQLNLTNDGYAAPFRNRPVQLLFVNGSNQVVSTVATDMRNWQPGQTTSLNVKGCAPTQSGVYSVYLNLPDSSSSLSSQSVLGDGSGSINGAYAVQLANNGTWDAAHGWNNLLQTVTVSASAGDSDPCS